MLVYDWLWWGQLANQNHEWRCTEVCRGAQRCAEVCGGVRRGAWRCAEGCVEVCRGAQRCAEGCAEGCAEVRRGVHGGVWRCVEGCAEGCTEVRRGAQRGAQRCAEVGGGARRCTEVHGGARRDVGFWLDNIFTLFVLGYHWLPLATTGLVGDNREFEVYRHILSCYTHYSWLIVLDIQSFITICPWLPLVAPSNHWFSGR